MNGVTEQPPPYTLARAARRVGVSRAWLVDLLDADQATASTVRTRRGPERQFGDAEVERLRAVRRQVSLAALDGYRGEGRSNGPADDVARRSEGVIRRSSRRLGLARPDRWILMRHRGTAASPHSP